MTSPSAPAKIPSAFLSWALLLVGASCSSWAIKDRCKSTNWFDYAQSVSFAGKYLEEDSFFKQCREFDLVSAQQLDQGFKLGREKGCSYDEIFRRGKLGQSFNFKFCDGLEPRIMTQKHLEGLAQFCTAENGFPYGKSGEVYQKLCSADQEKQFLPAYHKGRKLFLSDRQQTLNSEISSLQDSVYNLTLRESHASSNYNSIPNLQSCSIKQVYNETLKRDEAKQICEEASYLQMQRQSLMSQLDSIRGQLRTQNARLQEKQKQLSEVQLELSKIP